MPFAWRYMAIHQISAPRCQTELDVEETERPYFLCPAHAVSCLLHTALPLSRWVRFPQQPSVGSKLLALWLSLFWIYDTVTNSGPHGSRCFKLETKGYLFSVFSQTMTVNLNVYFLQLIYCVLRLLPTAPRSFSICFELPQLDFLPFYINA